jgi:hypothetical protein
MSNDSDSYREEIQPTSSATQQFTHSIRVEETAKKEKGRLKTSFHFIYCLVIILQISICYYYTALLLYQYLLRQKYVAKILQL